MLSYVKILLLSLAAVQAETFAAPNPGGNQVIPPNVYCTTSGTSPNVQQCTRAANNIPPTAAGTRSCGDCKATLSHDSSVDSFVATREGVGAAVTALSQSCKYGHATFFSTIGTPLAITFELQDPPSQEC